MDEKLIEEARLQNWRAWQQKSGGYCKVLCDVPPPDLPERLLETAVMAPLQSPTQSLPPSESRVAQGGTTTDLKKRTSSGWPPLVTIGSLLLLLYVAQQMEGNEAGSGRTMLGWAFGLMALAFFLYLVWGKSVTETGRNFVILAKSIVTFLIVVVMIGGLGQCVGMGGSTRESNTGGVPDSWSHR